MTAAGKGNIFHKSKLWKTGVVAGVSMLPRNDVAKPARDSSKYGSETRFTRVQEMKQARGPEHTKGWLPSQNPFHLGDSVFDSRRYDTRRYKYEEIICLISIRGVSFFR